MVVLSEQDEPFRSLHIYIGQPEARSIQAGLRGDKPVRLGTWDLLLAAIEALDGRLERAVIDRVEEARHYFASIEVRRGEVVHLLECRPSDAVALAVRSEGSGIFATEEVLAAAGRFPAPEG